ncbi:MAG: LLM class flavin-dependent oxidoreductase [Chloroflexia bacterium]|nr:LLM class flavin-dependent oxidoreductase [Chloroflexia bacterium]
MQTSKLGFGIVGTLDLDTVKAIAVRAEALSLDSLWVNDTPGGDSLVRLAAAASVTSTLRLATGVISVDRKPARQIVEEVMARGLPLDRLTIGVGSSAPPSPLRRMAENLAILREGLDVPVMVGSLGPKMRKLGAEQSNGLLFNWLTPRFALDTTNELRNRAADAGNVSVKSATYVRTALGDDALTRLEEEAARYSTIPSYAANFERLGITAMETAVYGESQEAIVSGISAFDGTVDEVVVRALTPTDDLDHYIRLLEAISPLAQSNGV